MSARKIVVHTDVILDHLRTRERPSLLRAASAEYFCYTTVFNAIELFSRAASEHERELVRDAMAALKVLGLNAKSALLYADLLRRYGQRKRWDLLVAGMCLESGLPLLTRERGAFSGMRGLKLIAPGKILRR
jgi:predicted nucleic acid-binding protein